METVRLDHSVRVPVPDHRNVEGVGRTAAGDHGVELLPGLLTSDGAVHGVGGDPCAVCTVPA